MTDATSSSGHYGNLIGGASRASGLRRRRAAETRLKAYGITAITLAAIALFSLIGSVVYQASGALTEAYVTLDVTLNADDVDPDGTKDPKKVLRADFGGLTKATLREAFPDVTARKAKRQLYDVVSSGSAFELADHVSNNTDLIGETISYRFLASDVTDLYLKGNFGKLREQEVRGLLSVFLDEKGKTATISSSSNDFADVLAQVKLNLIEDAKRLRRHAARQNNAVSVFQRRMENAVDEETRAATEAQFKTATTQRDKLLAEAEALEARAGGTEGAEDLSDDNRSIFIRAGGGWIKLTKIDATVAEGTVMSALSGDLENTDAWTLLKTDLPEAARKVTDTQIVVIEDLKAAGAIDSVFNWRFFSSGDSREPELAGIWGATVGSLFTMLVTFSLAFPIGVAAAIYLEEFAPKNKFTDLIEININNLAAVPSIVFGLLGLSVFLGVFGVPRSAPLAGGIVLALMTLPTIIIAGRAAIKAVPPSIRDAALGVGASKMQASFHHVLPLAMPGILTGTIIGMAQALGETAPLIMIGMVAFIVEVPTSITDSASVLPVQVFRWSDFPERAFEAKTGAAICVLLVFLVIMNAIAIVLRRRFERRW
ncbi:Phosphate transport system permease protein PstA [Candidatus Rhodobacter oscarellae]|uniref:Phosphate transport system permease protein PstA n=1 Tax=Candidatus Rhodobacter oscarellae TaxID=1675527 RepID=A0A0J9E3A3_9RHOB|nr:phosphate ABC transporter permease PstA [Candidatus Rhodobacter lobularis]KMW57255.1 Phosphate transport system permease protein PstA [Candidatus Rhodobacter lobularis]